MSKTGLAKRGGIPALLVGLSRNRTKALSYNHVDLKHPLLLLARRRIMPQDLEFRRGAYFWAFGVMAGLGTDDRRSAQPLAPREQL